MGGSIICTVLTTRERRLRRQIPCLEQLNASIQIILQLFCPCFDVFRVAVGVLRLREWDVNPGPSLGFIGGFRITGCDEKCVNYEGGETLTSKSQSEDSKFAQEVQTPNWNNSGEIAGICFTPTFIIWSSFELHLIDDPKHPHTDDRIHLHLSYNRDDRPRPNHSHANSDTRLGRPGWSRTLRQKGYIAHGKATINVLLLGATSAADLEGRFTRFYLNGNHFWLERLRDGYALSSGEAQSQGE
ncbi:hypothetical protein FB451DRAFT_1190363 [Mycena latifolia]|nr:hypothetical protein FB451DRAFT_1190363 [Mycena latifolia]